jgi:glutathione S-transferase
MECHVSVEFLSTKDAIARDGLRMTVVSQVPSPWGEAAKGIMHIKGVEWAAVGLDPRDPEQVKWTGQESAPVVMYGNEKPRAGWAEILLLLERVAPKPALLPADPADRALVLGLAHEICGEDGLSWARRVQLVHVGKQGAGGFREPVATYLADKYGYSTDIGEAATKRVTDLLAMLSTRLIAQREAGSSTYVGEGLSAVDIYSATAMALFRPLPDAQCQMRKRSRDAFETLDAETEAALHPILIEHRDRIYADHLELPLSL